MLNYDINQFLKNTNIDLKNIKSIILDKFENMLKEERKEAIELQKILRILVKNNYHNNEINQNDILQAYIFTEIFFLRNEIENLNISNKLN